MSRGDGQAAEAVANADLRARLEVAAGVTPAAVDLDDRSRRALDLAIDCGAPIRPALLAARDAADDERNLGRAVDVATAQARVVARALAALPVGLVVLLDLFLGLPLLGFYASPIGRLVLLAGLGAAGAGSAACSAMVRRVERGGRAGDPDDEAADLLAAAVAAGLPAAAAARVVADRRPDLARDLRSAALSIDHDRPVLAGTQVAEAMQVLAAATALGVPAAGELRSLAAEQRRREQSRVLVRAQRLPAQLAVPTVLLQLPATVLLVTAPLLAAGLQTA